MVAAMGQLPAPSQVAAVVATESVHDAVRHEVSFGAKPAQLARSRPSHARDAHGAAGSVAHAARPARGAPFAATHLPTLPGTEHASHCPAHAPSQHTPSTQSALSHSAFVAQATPSVFRH
jgi:hypothetical protein